VHYYGDYLRRLFVGGAVLSLLVLPFYQSLIPSLSFRGVIALMLVIIVFAGITNPRQKFTAWADLLISAILFIVFEYYTVSEYAVDDITLSLIRGVIGLVFVFSLYYSAKTVRGLSVRS
jgi:hypothetical protein